jgi:hypothetical protein
MDTLAWLAGRLSSNPFEDLLLAPSYGCASGGDPRRERLGMAGARRALLLVRLPPLKQESLNLLGSLHRR